MINYKLKSQRASVTFFFAITALMLIGIGGLAIDIGYVQYQKQLLQRASDSAALAAVLQVRTNNTAVDTEATTLLNANQVITPAEVVSIQCGIYNPVSKIFSGCSVQNNNFQECSSCASAPTNAVRVHLQRNVPSFLSRIFGITTFSPDVSSVAMVRFSNSAACIRPFGIEQDPNAGLNLINTQVGNTFTVGKNSPGNWGKLDIGGNMSSGTNFFNAMMNGACPNTTSIGQSVSPGTGGASIQSSFNALVAAQKEKDIVIAITTAFPNGNSGNVTILEFIMVDFVSQTGNGNNWQGTFRLKARNVSPPVGGGTGVISDRFLSQL